MLSNIWEKLKPTSLLEWFFIILITFVLLPFALPFSNPVASWIAAPHFFLFKLLFPFDAEAGFGAITGFIIFILSLTIGLTLVGIFLKKRTTGKISYPIIFSTILMVMITTISIFIQNTLANNKSSLQLEENKRLGSKINLTIKDCNLSEEKDRLYQRPEYYLLCNGVLKNLPKVSEDLKTNDFLSLEIDLENSRNQFFGTVTDNNMENPGEKDQLNFKVKIYLDETSGYQDIQFGRFYLHAGFNTYRHEESLNLPLKDYVKIQ